MLTRLVACMDTRLPEAAILKIYSLDSFEEEKAIYSWRFLNINFSVYNTWRDNKAKLVTVTAMEASAHSRTLIMQHDALIDIFWK